MNREKKQMAVIGVLVVLILGVGAFQMMRGGDAPPQAAPKKEEATKKASPESEITPPKNNQFHDRPAKDPFLPAGFILVGTKEDPSQQAAEKKPVQATHGNPKLGFESDGQLPKSDITMDPGGKKGIVPIAPPKPIFEYVLTGVIQGAHAAAVFDDGKGNQQLVEVGQPIGPNATLIQISRGAVRVKFNAETLVLNVGGNPNAK
jgi:hypothetical protein